jgi:3-oxoacyl-[acyl-carrier-protein] synthase III
MKLDAVTLCLPSRRLTNEDIIALVQQHSEPSFEGDLKKALHTIRLLLRSSGAQFRYWLGENQTPLALISQATQEALDEAECDRGEIDLLIYASADRGFCEPANAYFVAHALGMDRVQCFDVLDGCNGWTRAIHLSYSLLATGAYRRILILNSEFNMYPGGPVYPKLFGLRCLEELNWRFPGFTLGEGVTATIVSYDAEREWEFHHSSRTDLSELCSVPIRGYERYCLPSDRIGRNDAGYFASFGSEMFAQGTPEVVALCRQLRAPIDAIKAIIPHTASKRVWDEAARMCGLQHLMYYIYPRCGNLVSASVPAGISMAAREGLIGRGDRVVGCVGSAGMSFFVYSFLY